MTELRANDTLLLLYISGINGEQFFIYRDLTLQISADFH